MPKIMHPGKTRFVKVTIEIPFDHDDYCEAYGLHPDERAEVFADASSHLAAVVVSAADEAVKRLGVGASARVVSRS